MSAPVVVSSDNEEIRKFSQIVQDLIVLTNKKHSGILFGVMTTIDLLKKNWREADYREAYPMDETSIATLMELSIGSIAGGAALFGDCFGYVLGEPLRLCCYRSAGIIFGQFLTMPEFKERFVRKTSEVVA